VNELKNDISVHLQKIRKQVEENKLADKEREESSAQSFANVISKLNSSQDELTQLKSQLKETKNQLLCDSLTGLYNRLAYEDRVNVEFSRYKRSGAPLCIAMWDIDYFKKINDTHGHDVGDRVLKAFSDLIQTRIRKTDMFARMGGEEFVLLLPDTPIDVALSLNNKLREMVENCKFNYNEVEFTVTASVGLAEFCEHEMPEDILKKADLSLYQSKRDGRNRCTVFNE
jgi:diguanylate cyclase